MATSVKKRVLKISGYILGVIAVLLVSFHFWFINHAEQLLEDLVESKSNGKLKLHVKKFRFNWFSDNMQLRNAIFYSTDTATASTSYRLEATRINIRIKELWPLIFEKRILIDSLGLVNADIRVTRLKEKDTDTTRNLSLPLEMGRVYNSIQDALQVLQVKKFQIDNGKFTLINKIRPDAKPITITNIYLHLDNLQVDTNNTAGKRKILFSDNVTLHTYNQDISFPDGRHHISFANFRINLFNKMVEFDSCTIAATKGDSTNNSFKIFFDKLLLTNIDFDTLYQKEVIKADSVFCINPHFRIDVQLEKRSGKRRAPPRLDELIQLLTGDMRLGFVAVDNGSFDINTMREGKPSSFTSDHNNFAMEGLNIDKDAPRHLTVKSFAMGIRNYENFLRDSTYAMLFDSVLLINNSVFLSNFSVKQLQNENVINSFNMPQFELKGLSWDDLVFEGKLSAEKATLHRPVIDYTVSPKNKKQDVFHVLALIGDVIDLNNLDIDNGQINIHFKNGGHVQLENTSLSILSERLVQANRITDLQQSVRHLKFRKGLFKLKDIEMTIENGDFTGEHGQLTAEKVLVSNKKKNLRIDAKKVGIDRLIVDDNVKTEIDGIRWQEATIQLVSTPTRNKNSPDLRLKNIRGGRTKLAISSGGRQLKVFLDTLSADEFFPRRGGKPVITQLVTKGKDLSLIDSGQRLIVGRFQVADHQHSTIENLLFKKTNTPDSVSITIPSLGFTADIASIIDGKIIADDVSINRPVVHMSSGAVNSPVNKENQKMQMAIGRMLIKQPEVYLQQTGDKQFSKLNWKGSGSENDFLELRDFKISEQSAVSAAKARLFLQNFSFTADGKSFNTGTGEIRMTIDDFYIEPVSNGEQAWKGTIADLHAKGFSFDSIGKKNGQLKIESARLNGLALNSASFTRIRQLVKENKAFEIKEITGQYSDSDQSFRWFNASYDRSQKTFSLDSFTVYPVPPKDSFIAAHPYQADYITLKTGAISVDGFDLNGYLNDTAINASVITIDDAVMTFYRDKRLPLKAGLIKPLPATLIKTIPIHLSADSVRLNNARAEYSELNEQTNETGTVVFEQLNAKISPVKNYGLGQGDSLLIDARARLMDTIKIKLHINESYTDSLGGFLVNASATPTDAKILNPVLMPLASLKIKSGWLDTMSLQATATDYMAIGEMKLFYHDLKVEFINTKKEKKKKFLSFLANLFVKKNNRSKTGIIFWERLRDKSSLNYLVKIVTSGSASSIGIKNNKKLLRKYKKAQRKRNLPASSND